MQKPLKPGFHEQFFPADKIRVMKRVLREWQPVGGDVVEFGTWEGRSTIVLAKAFHPRIIDTVDHYRGGSSAIWAERHLAERRAAKAKAQCRANIAARTQGNVRQHLLDWREFATQYPAIVPGSSGTIALAHVDADHTYQEVYDNIVWLLNHTTPGALIIGDDYELFPEEARAVQAALPNHRHEGETWWAIV